MSEWYYWLDGVAKEAGEKKTWYTHFLDVMVAMKILFMI